LGNSKTFPKLEQTKRPQLQKQSNIDNNLIEEMVDIVENVSPNTNQANEHTNKSKSAFKLVNSQNLSVFFNNTNINQEEETVETVETDLNVNKVNNDSSKVASNSSVSKSPSVKSATYSSTSSASSSSVFLLNNTNTNNINNMNNQVNERINGQEYE